MGYVQHTPERVRQSFEKVFEGKPRHEQAEIQPPTTPEVNNNHWKKIAMQKYLTGEIDVDTLKTILETMGDNHKKEHARTDPSYR
ncbi:MAG: hypothetical protein ACP5FL_09360 [Thermoplasmatota archaeon]